MSSINSGISIYPSGYDLNVSGSTMVFVSDEVRDPFTGSVISSGTQIIGVHVNTAYTSIDKIERTLGTEPQGDYPTVADRILAIETVSGSTAFVHKTGDSMSGNLSMVSGASIVLGSVLSPSGANWSGNGTWNLRNDGNIIISGGSIQAVSSGSTILDFTNNLNIRSTNGPSNIISVSSGSTIFYKDILPNASGSINVGASGNPIGTLYVNNIPGLNALVGSGTFLPLTGGVISGTIILSGNSMILPSTDGVGFVGTLGSRIAQIWTNNVKVSVIGNNGVPVNMIDGMTMSADVYSSASGVASAGRASNPFSGVHTKTLFTNSIILSGTTLNPSTLITSSGGNISATGILTLTSGASIINVTSGVNNLASQSAPFANIWTNAINGRTATNFAFNETLGNPSSGNYTFAHPPSGAMVFDNRLYLVPTQDYTLSGNTLTLTMLYTASGTLYAGFYIY